jgi:hypothetical protein
MGLVSEAADSSQCGTAVVRHSSREWLSHLSPPDGCLPILQAHTLVCTQWRANDTTADKSHFTMTDVDTMPGILALITSCFNVFKILYVTVKMLVTQNA